MKNSRYLAGIFVVAAVAAWQWDAMLGPKSKLLADIENDDVAKVTDVFGTGWTKIYFLERFDLTQNRRLEIFGEVARDYADDVPWEGDRNFWTIIVTYPNRKPKIIRMDKQEHAQSRNSVSETTSRDAVVVKVSTTETDYNKKCAVFVVPRTCLRLEAPEN